MLRSFARAGLGLGLAVATLFASQPARAQDFPSLDPPLLAPSTSHDNPVTVIPPAADDPPAVLPDPEAPPAVPPAPAVVPEISFVPIDAPALLPEPEEEPADNNEATAADIPPPPVNAAPAEVASEPPTGAPEPVKALVEGPLHEAFLSPAKNRDRPRVEKAPPPPVVERPGVDRPSTEAQWIDGYWEWDAGRSDYLWVTGTWRVAPPGRFWVNGYWKRDDAGWYRVDGFWSDRQTDRLDFRKEGPPAERPTEDVGQAPASDTFYVPGQHVPDGDGVRWQAGYWTKTQAGWSWVPASWVKQPEGWTFQEGYWDRVLEDRGTLFAPAEVSQAAQASGEVVYQPVAQIAPETYNLLYGSLGRPTSAYDGYPGCYFDPSGRYFGYADYGNIGLYTGYLDAPYAGSLGYPYASSGLGGYGYDGGYGFDGGYGYGGGYGLGGFGNYGSRLGGFGNYGSGLGGFGGGFGGLGLGLAGQFLGGSGFGGGYGYGSPFLGGYGLPFAGGFGSPLFGGYGSGYGRNGYRNGGRNGNDRYRGYPFYPGNGDNRGQRPGYVGDGDRNNRAPGFVGDGDRDGRGPGLGGGGLPRPQLPTRPNGPLSNPSFVNSTRGLPTFNQRGEINGVGRGYVGPQGLRNAYPLAAGTNAFANPIQRNMLANGGRARGDAFPRGTVVPRPTSAVLRRDAARPAFGGGANPTFVNNSQNRPNSPGLPGLQGRPGAGLPPGLGRPGGGRAPIQDRQFAANLQPARGGNGPANPGMRIGQGMGGLPQGLRPGGANFPNAARQAGPGAPGMARPGGMNGFAGARPGGAGIAQPRPQMGGGPRAQPRMNLGGGGFAGAARGGAPGGGMPRGGLGGGMGGPARGGLGGGMGGMSRGGSAGGGMGGAARGGGFSGGGMGRAGGGGARGGGGGGGGRR